MDEPSPFRDNGPYADAAQALRQFNATTFGLPVTVGTTALLDLVLGEALLISGADPSEFETDYVREFNQQVGLDPLVSQILGAWLIRAHLAGLEKGKASVPEVDLETGRLVDARCKDERHVYGNPGHQRQEDGFTESVTCARCGTTRVTVYQGGELVNVRYVYPESLR